MIYLILLIINNYDLNTKYTFTNTLFNERIV